MSKKSKEIRCPNTRVVKGREIECGRFLVQISDDEIRVRCPKCGALHSIIRDKETGSLRLCTIPEASALISKKEEK
jgi:phage FluMu protein Com